MSKIVTIGIPIYKRLTTLPQALQSVAAQDYPRIELIVSDNGVNGNKVKEIVEQCYPQPFRFRQNPATVPISPHYNQLIEAATGEFCVILDDDDTLSPNFVSELVGLFDRHPEVAVAMAGQEVVDVSGKVLRRSSAQVPELLTGEEFIRTWNNYGFECYTAMMGRTAEMKQCGGYEDFPRGTHADDALLIKLGLTGSVAFSTRSTFRWRIAETSFGWSMSCEELAEDTRQFLSFLNSHPTVLAYASRKPELWAQLKPDLMKMGWYTYYERWAGLYRDRLSFMEWIKAGFAMPFIAEYYRGVRSTLWYESKTKAFDGVKRRWPWMQRIWQSWR
jgi:glycosyltransferase involved in cell wall biosynthesis